MRRLTQGLTSHLYFRQFGAKSGSLSSPTFLESGHVYFVATPIGNLKDISERAIDILTHVDVICAEDTRHTIQLLRGLSLPQKSLLSHHEHNWRGRIPQIVSLAKEGKSIAVVSDAGTPGISDPGAELAAALNSLGVPVHPVPGPCAVIAALSVCGFTGTDFTFMGFLPTKSRDRKIKLSDVYNTRHTVVLFEAPHRILKTLSALLQLDPREVNTSREAMSGYSMSERACVCCRELTKLHEEVKSGTVQSIHDWLAARDASDRDKMRGEFCVVLGPVKPTKWVYGDDSNDEEEEETEEQQTEGASGEQTAEEAIVARLTALRSDGMSRKEAVKLVVDIAKVPRNVVYKMALQLPWEKH